MDALKADTHARFVPGQDAHWLDSSLHLDRYEWVTDSLVKPQMSVVDLGCGTGYGCEIICASGARVLGVDLDPAVRSRNHGPNPTFECCDITSPRLTESIPDSTADVVICFETIEHVEDYFQLLENAAHIVKTDGVLVISTPNRRMTYERYPGRRHMDESHVQEFTPTSLRKTLDRYFRDVSLLYQVVPNHGSGNTQPNRTRSLRNTVRSALPSGIVRLSVHMRRKLQSRKSRADSSVAHRRVETHFLAEHEDSGAAASAFALIAICRGPSRPGA